MKTESEKQMLILEGISGPVQLTLAGISGPIQVILPPQADDTRVGYPLLEEDAMKRDLDLAKKIMLELEGWEMPKYSSNLNIDGYMSDEVDYHLDQLIISGLIDAAVIRVKGPQGRPIWDIQRVTWSGHDFLLLSREPKIWPEAKKKFIAEGGTLAFNAVLRVMFELGKTEVQKLLGG